jgi:hypothetical protein
LGRTQTSVSLPKAWMEWIEKFYAENREVLLKWDVDSPAKLVKVLANFGRQPLEEAIAELKQREKGKSSLRHGTTE